VKTLILLQIRLVLPRREGREAGNTIEFWEAGMTSPDDDLKARAKQHVQQLPAETALGNPDPAGGVDDDPKILDEAAEEEPQQ
jgi:hypothetical protein